MLSQVAFNTLLDRIICADALAFLRGLPDESVNCIVTSPPYNLRNSTGNGLIGQNNKSLWKNQPMNDGYDGQYSDDLPHDVYVAWQRDCLSEMLRVVSSSGFIFYNHKWRIQDGQFQRLGDEIVKGFPLRQIIIWSRGGGINFNDGYFVPSYEVIYVLAPSRSSKLKNGMNRKSDVWNIPPAKNKNHPNAFPLELAENCIHAGSLSGEIIFDPFGGIGTTAVAAKKLGRRFMACDINLSYINVAHYRLGRPMDDMFLASAS